jgi:hypothetical protein
LKLEAVQVFREVKKIRRSKDVSFYEDAELNGEKHKSINAVIKHLLVGHEGKPCPSGDMSNEVGRVKNDSESFLSRLWTPIRKRSSTL